MEVDLSAKYPRTRVLRSLTVSSPGRSHWLDFLPPARPLTPIPAVPAAAPPSPERPPPAQLRARGHRLPALLDRGRHQPGVRLVKQAWAGRGGGACLVLGCTDMKLSLKQDLSHPRALLYPHTTLLSSVWSEDLNWARHFTHSFPVRDSASCSGLLLGRPGTCGLSSISARH